MPESNSSVTSGAAAPVASLETINRNPVPDSETLGGDPTRFDSEFDYLASPGAAGAEKQGAVSETGKETPAGEPSKDSHTPEGQPKKPDYAVPPIAQNVEQILKEDQITKATLADDPSAKAQSSAGQERTYSQTEVSAIQSAKDTEIKTLKGTLQEYTSELEKLKDAKVALDELNQNPLAFIARYFPELAAQVDSRKVIVDRLRKEFGDELDLYDPSQIHNPESPSYKIQRRELEIQSEVARSAAQAEHERLETERKRVERFNESKKKVMATYGLNEEQFQKEIVEWANGQQFDYEMVARLKFRDWEIQRAIDEALKQAKHDKPGQVPTSVALVGGGEPKGAPEHLKELSDAFGDM